MKKDFTKISKKIFIVFLLIICMSTIMSMNVNATETTQEVQLADVLNKITNVYGGIVSIVTYPLRALILILFYGINLLLLLAAKAEGVTNTAIGTNWFITPFDIFFNRFKILDVNFFDISAAGERSLVYNLRSAISKWYIFVRNLSTSLLLLVLIYVGIRMALSTLAEDKAKYKKMLMDWVASLCLIYILHYIIIFIVYGNDAIVHALYQAFASSGNNVTSIEQSFTDMFKNAILGVGLKSMSAAVVFSFVTAQTIGFFIAYLNRMIKIGFLIIIAPLISITYSIDKIGDGKAQALGAWLKEFAYTILIQPFHCIMYVAFAKTSFELITQPSGILNGIFTDDFNQLALGLIAIFSLWFMKDAEKAVRKIFGFADDGNDTSFVAGMAVGMAALNKSKSWSKTASQFHSKTSANMKKYSGAFKQGLNNSSTGRKVLNFSANKIAPVKDKLMKPIDKAKKVSQKVGEKKDELLSKSNLARSLNEKVLNNEKLRTYANKTMVAAGGLAAGVMVAAAGNNLGVAAGAATQVGENIAKHNEEKGVKYDLSSDEKADRIDRQDDIQDRIDSESKIVNALSGSNRSKTVAFNEQYLEREQKLMERRKELLNNIDNAQPENGEEQTEEQKQIVRESQAELDQIGDELNVPLDGDNDGVALDIFNKRLLVNDTPVDPKDESKGVKTTMKSDSEIDDVHEQRQTQVRILREEKKNYSSKNYAKAKGSERASRGSDGKNLANAKSNLLLTFSQLVIDNKYKEDGTDAKESERINDFDKNMINEAFESIIAEMDLDIANQKSYSSKKETYTRDIMEKLNLDPNDEDVKAEIRLALAKYVTAKQDSEFAKNYKNK